MVIIYSARTGTVRQIHPAELLETVREQRKALEALVDALRALKRERVRVRAVATLPTLVQSIIPTRQ